MDTITLDPVLKRLMDRLPKGDPDVQPPDMIEVSIPWCPNRHEVPRATKIAGLDMGAWAGPPTNVKECPIHCKNLRTGVEQIRYPGSALSEQGRPVIFAGSPVFLTNWSFDV